MESDETIFQCKAIMSRSQPSQSQLKLVDNSKIYKVKFK